MLAGFLTGFMKNGDYYEAFDLALAAGSACAFRPGLPKAKDIYDMYELVKEQPFMAIKG
jgi:fructose-1-phosphate kinase PfkB-like protein